jgi:hypothetical protein
MKAVTGVHSFFQEESQNMKNNQPIISHTKVLKRVYAALKVRKNTARGTIKDLRPAIHQLRNWFLFARYCYNVI